MFYNFLFKQEVVAAPVTSRFSSLIAFLEEAFIRNSVSVVPPGDGQVVPETCREFEPQ
jgi:hypothetical protein